LNATETLLQLKPTEYWFKKEKNKDRKTRKFGFIAQEIDEVLPNTVRLIKDPFNEDAPDDLLGIEYIHAVLRCSSELR
jgi:hypothetical protein